MISKCKLYPGDMFPMLQIIDTKLMTSMYTWHEENAYEL